MHRAVWLWLDLGADPANVDIHGPWIADLVGTPHAIEQLSSRVGAAGMRRQGCEELELLWSKVDRGPVQPQLMGHEVKFEAIPDLEVGGWPRSHTLIEVGRPFGEFACVDRLRQRLVKPHPECGDPLRDRSHRAQVDGPQTLSSADAFSAQVPQFLVTRRRLGHDRNPRMIGGQQVAERVWIRDDPHVLRCRRQAAELRGRSVRCEYKPGCPALGRAEAGRFSHPWIVARVG